MHGAVVGAGIGGLVMAHALRRIGVSVDLLEKAPEARSTGYQLNVLPNGKYALGQLGLLDVERAPHVARLQRIGRRSAGMALTRNRFQHFLAGVGMRVLLKRSFEDLGRHMLRYARADSHFRIEAGL